MPTYDYECEKCGKAFEFFQSMKDDPLTTCPDEACGGKVKRLIGTGAGLIFKGSGFYITDYRSNGYKEAAKKDASAATGGSGGSSGGGGASTPAAASGASQPAKPASPSAAS